MDTSIILKRLIEQTGDTVEEFAKKVGEKNKNNIYANLSGKRSISFPKLEKWAKEYGLFLDFKLKTVQDLAVETAAILIKNNSQFSYRWLERELKMTQSVHRNNNLEGYSEEEKEEDFETMFGGLIWSEFGDCLRSLRGTDFNPHNGVLAISNFLIRNNDSTQFTGSIADRKKLSLRVEQLIFLAEEFNQPKK